MPWLSKSCVYIPFPKHVCGHERWPSFRCNAFSIWHTTLSVRLLKYHVWCVYAADSLQRRRGNLKFIPIQSDWEALELWKEAACFFHPCDSTESWVPCHFFTVGIWSPACFALISDKMLKVKCMLARPTLLPFKMHGIVSFVNNKICWWFWGCGNYPVMPRRADGRVWWGRERAEWYLKVSDLEGDCETQTAQGRPEPDWLRLHCNYSLQRSVRRRSVLRQRLPPTRLQLPHSDWKKGHGARKVVLRDNLTCLILSRRCWGETSLVLTSDLGIHWIWHLAVGHLSQVLHLKVLQAEAHSSEC